MTAAALRSQSPAYPMDAQAMPEAANDSAPKPKKAPLWISTGPAWSILRVTPNMARKVAAALGPKTEENPHGAGLRTYVPIEKYRPKRTWRSRTRPLIPGYVFVEILTDEQLDQARGNYAVLDVMCRDGRPVKLPAIVIGALVLFEAMGEFDMTWGAPAPLKDKGRGRRAPRHAWKSGQRVKILEGPFASFMADIISAERADRIEALVSIFGRETPVTFDEEMLEPPPST